MCDGRSVKHLCLFVVVQLLPVINWKLSKAFINCPKLDKINIAIFKANKKQIILCV